MMRASEQMRLLTVGILFLFLSGGFSHAFAEGKPVRLQLQWSHQSQFAGYYVALGKGFYREQGLDVTIFAGGPAVEPADVLQRNEAEFASLWLSTALTRRDKGEPLVNVAQVVNASNLILLAWKGNGVAGPEDLPGRKISIWGGDFRVPYAAWLQYRKIDATVVPQYYSVNLFLRKGVDACAAMYYNEYHMLFQAGVNPDEVLPVFLRDDGFGFPEDGIYALEDTVRKDPEMSRAFREASLKGWKYAALHQEEALDIVMKYVREGNVQTNRPHMKWMLEKILASIVPAEGSAWEFGRLSRAEYERTTGVMLRQGMISQTAPFEAFIGGGLNLVP